MTHNTAVESQRKCRRLFYNKTTGKVIAVASGGGALETLEGDPLIIATFNDLAAPQTIECFEQYFTPLHGRTPDTVNLARCPGYKLAVNAHRAAEAALTKFIFEQSILMTGTERTQATFAHWLAIQEVSSRTTPAHLLIETAIARLQSATEACAATCDKLLLERDRTVNYQAASQQPTV